jgi:hypothetical protein
MRHLFCAEVVKKMTASIELSVAQETSTMTLPIVRRAAICGRSARRRNGLTGAIR